MPHAFAVEMDITTPSRAALSDPLRRGLAYPFDSKGMVSVKFRRGPLATPASVGVPNSNNGSLGTALAVQRLATR